MFKFIKRFFGLDYNETTHNPPAATVEDAISSPITFTPVAEVFEVKPAKEKKPRKPAVKKAAPKKAAKKAK